MPQAIAFVNVHRTYISDTITTFDRFVIVFL